DVSFALMQSSSSLSASFFPSYALIKILFNPLVNNFFNLNKFNTSPFVTSSILLPGSLVFAILIKLKIFLSNKGSTKPLYLMVPW
ncbi:hypothetical protein OAB78_01150, partial [Pelagibacteraceae bacterium]|nr:hypothetical protein [Pelagibacteraceae bacterium]